ncbi:MAG TPA: RDD family protein [Polyangia bacterium]|jgi:uncharacterized RDD family membrane protein YckC
MEGMNRFGKPDAEPPSEAEAAAEAAATPAPAAASAASRGSARVIDIDDSMIGRRFDHFEVRARLGYSGSGTVYLAEDISLQQPVMLTMLRRVQAVTDVPGGDILAAPRAQARVNHQNVAQVRFVGVAEGNPFVVAEHVDGRSLREEIKQTGAIAWPEAVAYMVQIVRALQAAQEVGLAHGALTPANIILRRHGDDPGSPVEVKVDGFGVPAPADGASDNPYQAPERRAGGLPSMRADMYALGVIFQEMLTAAAPGRNERPIPERLAPHYIRRLVAFLKRDDPKQRPSVYEELLGRLEVAFIQPPVAQPLVARAAAFGIDLLVLVLMMVASLVLLPRLAPATRWESAELGFIFFAAYSIVAHKNGGQTVGKQICGVILVEPRHSLSWPRMLARFIVQMWGPIAAAILVDVELGTDPTLTQIGGQLGGALAVLGALWLASFLVVFTDKKAIALHDHVTGTSVVVAS